MSEKNAWESVKAEGGAVVDKLREIIHEGNVRRVRVRQGDRRAGQADSACAASGAASLDGCAGKAAGGRRFDHRAVTNGCHAGTVDSGGHQEPGERFRGCHIRPRNFQRNLR